MIKYVVEIKDNYSRAPWLFFASFNRLKDALALIDLRQQSYPNAQHRVVKYKRERIYTCKNQP